MALPRHEVILPGLLMDRFHRRATVMRYSGGAVRVPVFDKCVFISEITEAERLEKPSRYHGSIDMESFCTVLSKIFSNFTRPRAAVLRASCTHERSVHRLHRKKNRESSARRCKDANSANCDLDAKPKRWDRR